MHWRLSWHILQPCRGSIGHSPTTPMHLLPCLDITDLDMFSSCWFHLTNLTHYRSFYKKYTEKQGEKSIRQGLGYSGDSTAKVLTKFCTPNSSPKKFWLCTKKSSQAFQPCMTLWVQNWPKLPKKIIFSQKSPSNFVKALLTFGLWQHYFLDFLLFSHAS